MSANGSVADTLSNSPDPATPQVRSARHLGFRIEPLKPHLVRLLVVVLGALIALGLYSLFEAQQDRALVHHSLTRLRIEAQANQAQLEIALEDYNASDKALADLVAQIEARLQDPASAAARIPQESLNVLLPPVRLDSGAWQAAMATHAVSTMNLSQADLWSNLYAQQERMQQDQADSNAFGYRFRVAFETGPVVTREEQAQQLTLLKEAQQRIRMAELGSRGMISGYRFALTQSAKFPETRGMQTSDPS